MSDFLKLLKETMSQVYFIIIFTVLTLYMHDGYYDTLEAKGNMLLWTTFFYVVTMLIVYILLWISEKRKHVRNLNALDCGMLVFSVIVLVSAQLSGDKVNAFWGSDGCRVGAIVLCLLCLSAIFLSKSMKLSRYLVLIIVVSGYIVYAAGISDCFDMDLMKWRVYMTSSPYDFLSTIGNRDWYVGYLALLLPFICVLYLYEKNKKMRVLYAVYLVLGFVNLYITKNNGNLLVFGCAIPLVYLALQKREHYERLLQILWIFILASVIVKVMCCIVEPSHVVGISALGTLQEHHWYIALAVFAILLKVVEEKLVPLQFGMKWLVFSAVVIFGMFVIVAAKFDGTFGSNRGYIWQYATKTFSQSGTREKLLGWGADCFKDAVYTHAGEDIMATWPENNNIANAHNEVLQYLVTTGVIGMLSYLSLYALAFYRMVKKRDMLAIAGGTAVFTYFCTALGNNPQPLNYGVLFVMFAVIHMKEKGL